MTAGWGEGWIWPPAGVEDDRWAEGGEYNRQQVWRMTAGRKGESLTASSVKAYRETSFKSWNLWRVTWNVDDAVKNDKRTPRWPVTRRLNSMTRWRVTHRQKYDACPALLLLYKNIGVRKKNSLLILNLDIQSELSATPIHQSHGANDLFRPGAQNAVARGAGVPRTEAVAWRILGMREVAQRMLQYAYAQCGAPQNDRRVYSQATALMTNCNPFLFFVKKISLISILFKSSGGKVK